MLIQIYYYAVPVITLPRSIFNFVIINKVTKKVQWQPVLESTVLVSGNVASSLLGFQ